MKGAALVCTLLAGVASAHMQMMKPYPIRSPLNKDAKGQKDYSYTNPLQPSGADYPCKGYAKDDFDSQATYKPGQQYTMELDGSATHDGGSCQLALTYDQGKTFKVIESMLGTCPIEKKYDFTIPSDAPSGEALLAWTWFNKVGNREMYMNCAMVTIGGDSDGKEADAETEHTKNKPAHPQKEEEKKASHPPMELAGSNEKMHHQRDAMIDNKKMSFDSLPELFVANVDQAGKCVTIEGEAVNFPKPGDNVKGKADGKGYKCSGNAPFLDSGDSDSDSSKKADNTEKSDSKNQKEDPSSKEKEGNKNATRSTPETMSKIAQAFGTSPAGKSRVVSTDATTNNEFSNYVGGWTCTSGEIVCSPDGYSWAMCSNNAPVYMGAVAAGMVCRCGAMVAAAW